MSPPAQEGPPTPTLFDAEPFAGFGPSRFRPAGEISVGQLIRARSSAKLRHGLKAHAPRLPGVYAMLDPRGRVVYVGKAKSLRGRLMSYFRSGRDPKAGRILRVTRTLVWEQACDEFAALLRELELIRRFRPRFNVLGQPGPRRSVYLCVGKPPAAFAYLTRDPTGKELAIYGPIGGRGRAEEAVRRLNDRFRLRDCPSTVKLAFADQPDLFPDDRAPRCLRFDIGTCAGPCAGLCTRQEYAANVRAAKAFLDGRDKSVLVTLTRQMTEAAAALKYEQATAIRDRLQLLTWLDDRLTFLRQARKGGSFVYPLAGHAGPPVWYLIHRGEVAAAVREPHDDATRAAAVALLEQVCKDNPADDRVTDRTVDSVLLVAAWFRRFAAEKERLMKRAQVAALCVTPASA